MQEQEHNTNVALLVSDIENELRKAGHTTLARTLTYAAVQGKPDMMLHVMETLCLAVDRHFISGLSPRAFKQMTLLRNKFRDSEEAGKEDPAEEESGQKFTLMVEGNPPIYCTYVPADIEGYDFKMSCDGAYWEYSSEGNQPFIPTPWSHAINFLHELLSAGEGFKKTYDLKFEDGKLRYRK